jgi:hypothetical protein
MKTRADCLEPWILKGRGMETGRANDEAKD